ncbi:MAG: DUF3311 domain-containing protein [Acidobacteriota bacterium]|nr:DUF3311 domain-containing protein [Acidobacteriota bacterium]
MSGKGIRAVLYTALVIFYLLHNDLWLWDDASTVLGLPVGLVYHIAYCLAAAGLMVLVVRFAWPSEFSVETERDKAP